MDAGGVGDKHRGARRAAVLAVAGLVVYVLVDVALRILEPQYSLLRNAESDHGNGHRLDAHERSRGSLLG